MKIQNPHDKFFKETFGKSDVAKDFLNNYLPQEIREIVNIDTLEPQKDSFVNQELQEGFSDMLFKSNINNNEGYVYFLFEHKSYSSKDAAFQLLKYIIKIWEAKIKKESASELPVIIPILIYHGKYNWNSKLRLGEMIAGYELLSDQIKKYIPDFEYLLFNLSRYSDEEIKGKAHLRIMLTIFRDIFTKDANEFHESMIRAIKYLSELDDKQTGIEYFETMMRYIFNVRSDLTEKDIEKLIAKIENNYPEGSDVVMTLAERFVEKGIEKGMEKGIEKGETNALVKTAIKLLIKKFGNLPEEVKTKISKLDNSSLEIIIEGIFEYKSLDDIKKYLG